MEAAQKNQGPALPLGANQHTTKDVPKSENGTSYPRGSNQASTRVRRLRRDHRDIAERLEQGEFKSVAAAERAARGEEPHPAYPKKTAAMWLEHWWNKADEKTRREFLAKRAEEGTSED
jgi:hypothetical protein